MNTLIRGDSLIKSYGSGTERRTILNSVCVDIARGEYVAIMGPSGSGKSTLLYALSGMDGVDSGSVTFDGLELTRLKENALADLRRRRMGFIFQQPTLLRNLTLLDNIMLPAMRDNRKQGAKLADKARGLMARTGIAELESRDTSQASGGQLQRVGICRALMGDPAILFGDEPTGALDSSSATEILQLLDDIHRSGVAILLVTHDPKVAARAERVLFLLDGSIAGEYTARPQSAQAGDEHAETKARQKALGEWLAEMEG